jgi:hypothetical protein
MSVIKITNNRNSGSLFGNLAGSTAVEFGLIAGMIVLTTAAIIEFSLVMFDYSRATEATRRATRLASLMTPVGNLDGLESTDVVCGSSGGSTSCSGGPVFDASSFDKLVARMQQVLPGIQPENVEVAYRPSGIGSAESGGYKPYVTVRLQNLQHEWLFLGPMLGLSTDLTYPAFSTTLLGNVYQPA